MFFTYAKISASTGRIVAADVVFCGDKPSLPAFNDWANSQGYTEFSGTAQRPAWFDCRTGAVVAWVITCEDRAYAAASAYAIVESAKAAAIAYSFVANS